MGYFDDLQKSPARMGLLAAGLGMLQNSRGVSLGESVGRGGMQGLQAYGNAIQQQKADQDSLVEQQIKQAQLQKIQNDMSAQQGWDNLNWEDKSAVANQFARAGAWKEAAAARGINLSNDGSGSPLWNIGLDKYGNPYAINTHDTNIPKANRVTFADDSPVVSLKGPEGQGAITSAQQANKNVTQNYIDNNGGIVPKTMPAWMANPGAYNGYGQYPSSPIPNYQPQQPPPQQPQPNLTKVTDPVEIALVQQLNNTQDMKEKQRIAMTLDKYRNSGVTQSTPPPSAALGNAPATPVNLVPQQNSLPMNQASIGQEAYSKGLNTEAGNQLAKQTQAESNLVNQGLLDIFDSTAKDVDRAIAALRPSKNKDGTISFAHSTGEDALFPALRAKKQEYMPDQWYQDLNISKNKAALENAVKYLSGQGAVSDAERRLIDSISGIDPEKMKTEIIYNKLIELKGMIKNRRSYYVNKYGEGPKDYSINGYSDDEIRNIAIENNTTPAKVRAYFASGGK